MTEINKRFKITEKVTVSIIHPETDDQAEYIVGPGDGEFSFDGDNILFHDARTGKTWTTINMNGFIDVMVESGRLAPVEDDDG